MQLLTFFRRDSNIACVLQILSLNDMPTFQHVSDACIALKLTCRIDMDALYDEFSYALQHTVKWEKTVGEKWQQFFACAKNVSNVVHLVSFVLSMREYFLLRIQSGAATETERVFL